MESALLVQTNALVKKALKLLQTALKVQSSLLNSYVRDVMHIDEYTVQPCRLTNLLIMIDVKPMFFILIAYCLDVNISLQFLVN